MARSGNVLLPFFLSRDEKESDPDARELLERWALKTGGPAVRPTGTPARSVSLPVRELAAAAARMGNVQFVPDGDSVYRRLPLVIGVTTVSVLPCLPLALADFLGAGPDPAEVPLDRSGAMILRFFGPERTYKTYSIGAIINSQARIEEGLEPQVQPAEFSGKTVIVGATAAGPLRPPADALRRRLPGHGDPGHGPRQSRPQGLRPPGPGGRHLGSPLSFWPSPPASGRPC